VVEGFYDTVKAGGLFCMILLPVIALLNLATGLSKSSLTYHLQVMSLSMSSEDRP